MSAIIEFRLEKGASPIDECHERLTNELLRMNPKLSYARARTWVELFWEDFESTYAKAGRPYQGKSVAEKVVRVWIKQYGKEIHNFAAHHPKYARMLTSDQDLTH